MNIRDVVVVAYSNYQSLYFWINSDTTIEYAYYLVQVQV